MTDILRKKDYPLNYPSEITDILEAMSFSKGKSVDIVGSMSLKSQQYAGDYDMFETVQASFKTDSAAVAHFVKQFQDIVARVSALKNTFVGDIKAGEIPEWNVLADGVQGVEARLRALHDADILSQHELDEIEPLLKHKDEMELRAALKFHVVRWTPADVAKGSCVLRDGRTFTLKEAFLSPAVIKLDVVALVQNSRYTDFSILYQLKNNGHVLNAFSTGNEAEDIKRDLAYYYAKGNYFKALKRMFSLAKRAKDTRLVLKLNELMNGDLGRLYSVVSDIGTLLFLLENERHLPLERIRYELDQFRARLGNVYTLSGPNKVLKQVVEAKKNTKRELERMLVHAGEELEDILARAAKKAGVEAGLFPVPRRFRPSG
jgi:hypothetical protein